MIREPAPETPEISGPPPDAGPGQGRSLAATHATAGAKGGSLALMLFIASLFIPGSFAAGPVSLTFYKLFLLTAAVPLGLYWIRGRAGGIVAPDILVLAFCLWQALSILANNGLSQIVVIGTNIVETAGGYLAGRVLVRSAADYRAFFRYFLTCLVVLLPFVLVEFLTGKRFLKHLLGLVLDTESGAYAKREVRLGFVRPAVGFPHPILYGFVCSLAVANTYYIYAQNWLGRMIRTGFVVFMTVLSLSSAPMLSTMLQIGMIGWDRIVRVLRGHWILFVLIGVVSVAVLHLALPGGLVGYIVNEVIFNPIGGNNRIEIFRYGIEEVARHPLLGIGRGDWARPFWQHGSVDNFWLLTAMRYGIPGLLLIVLAIGISAARIMRAQGLTEEETRYRTGYMIALCGMVLVLSTVAIWGAPVPLVMAYLGAGVWFYAGRDVAEARTRPARRSAATARQPLPGRKALPARASGAAASAAAAERGHPPRRPGDPRRAPPPRRPAPSGRRT